MTAKPDGPDLDPFPASEAAGEVEGRACLAPSAACAQTLCSALPGHDRGGARRPHRLGRGNARRAACRAAHDRCRLQRGRAWPGRQIFRNPAWRRPHPRHRQRRPLLLRELARRARRRRYPRRHLQTSHRPQPRLLRDGAFGRGDVAADRRHHANQGGGEHDHQPSLAQPRDPGWRRGHDDRHQPETVIARADRHSDHRAAACRLWPRGPLALARGARQPRPRFGLCERKLEPGEGAAGLHP